AAIGIGEPHPQPLAADADARIHADRVVVEPDDPFRRGRRRGPGADPTIAVLHRPSFHRSMPRWCRPVYRRGNGFARPGIETASPAARERLAAGTAGRLLAPPYRLRIR